MKISAVLVVVVLAIPACGGGGGGDSGATPPGSADASGPPAATPSTKPGATSAAKTLVDCPTQWTRFLATKPLGLSFTHRSTTTSHGDGVDFDGTRVTLARQTVTAASADAVTTELGSRELSPHADAEELVLTSTTTKEFFLATCSPLPEELFGPGDIPIDAAGIKVEPLLSRDEPVTVPAGSFPSRYGKTRVSGHAFLKTSDDLFESWTLTAFPSITAREVDHYDVKLDQGGAYTSDVEEELVALTLP